MILKPYLGWNRVKPVQELRVIQGGECECSVLQNYIYRDKKLKKVGGTVAYNSTSLGNLGVPLVLRSYHIRADGEIVKRTHCYYDGTIYYGDEVTGNLRPTNMTTLSKDLIPTYFSMQVAGNSMVFMLNAKDEIIKYDGNASYTWEVAGGDLAGIYEYESAVMHLDRAWFVKKQSSEIDYSESLNPEYIEDTFVVGQDKDSYNMRIVIGSDETMYVFKNNSIYQLYGRTPSQFQLRKVTDKYGLATKRGICPVGNGFVFVNTYDKELYYFGGTEGSIYSLTEDDIRLRDLMDHTPQALENIDMCVFDGLFRFSFQHKESAIDHNNCELVYALSEPKEGNLPKWSLIKGTNVLSYSIWNKYGDYQLVTGRSEIGKLMYHNRGTEFDNVAIETQVRTAEVTFSEDSVGKIRDIFVKGKPGSYNTTALFRYFMNGRFTNRGEESLSLRGETRSVGELKIQTQSLFNDRIIPLTEYRRGNSISFEIYDNNIKTEMEIYSIAFNVAKRYKIRNQYI